MRNFFSSLASAASLLSLASAHGGVGYYVMNGKTYQGWQPYNSASGQSSIQRQYPSYDPLLIADLSGVRIRCNNAGLTGTGLSGEVAAGSKLLAHWTQWTHRPGPVLVYMAKCPSSGCNSWDGSGTVWFKIDEAGLLSGTQNAGTWGNDQIFDTLNWTTTVPASLAPGEYLIRHELIALHQANNPQFYPECAQLKVTGSGTDSPSGSYLVAFPGAYKSTDPGIAFNIDSDAAKTATTYDIPGPSVWPGTGSSNGGGSGGSGSSTTSAPVVTPTSSVVTSLTSSTMTSAVSTSPTCTVQKYGQCGGSGYSGCKTCASGATCSKLNDFYSQCL